MLHFDPSLPCFSLLVNVLNVCSNSEDTAHVSGWGRQEKMSVRWAAATNQHSSCAHCAHTLTLPSIYGLSLTKYGSNVCE